VAYNNAPAAGPRRVRPPASAGMATAGAPALLPNLRVRGVVASWL
jgi:hypothetical protein